MLNTPAAQESPEQWGSLAEEDDRPKRPAATGIVPSWREGLWAELTAFEHVLLKWRRLLIGTALLVLLVGALYISPQPSATPAGRPTIFDQIMQKVAIIDVARIAVLVMAFLVAGTITWAVMKFAQSARRWLRELSEARESRLFAERNRRIVETLTLIEDSMRSAVGVDD
jgi:hypothetical protein